MFDSFTPKLSKENIEEFGKLLDYHNQKVVEAKCRKYSIIDDDETDSNSIQLNCESCNSNKRSFTLKGNCDFTIADSDLKLNEQEYEKCYKSPQRISKYLNSTFNTSGVTSWSYEKKPKLENPFRSRIEKTKLNFNLISYSDTNSSIGNKSEIKPFTKHGSVVGAIENVPSQEIAQFLVNGKRKNTFN